MMKNLSYLYQTCLKLCPSPLFFLGHALQEVLLTTHQNRDPPPITGKLIVDSRILACDRPEKFEALSEEFRGQQNIEITRDGFAVSRAADYIIYSVEAASIDTVIARYGPGTTTHSP